MRYFFKQGDAQDLEDFVEAAVELQFSSQDCHQQVGADRDPDLRLDGIGGEAEDVLDPQVLLDPFEEQFDLPSALVELRDSQSRKVKRVGQQNESSPMFGVVEGDAAQGV